MEIFPVHIVDFVIKQKFSCLCKCSEIQALPSYIPLTNRVRGPYRKLRTEFFPPRFYGPSAKRAGHKSKGKKRGSVTYGTDRENDVSKIFIISLVCVCVKGSGNDSYSRETASNF